MDNLKISHANLQVVTKFILALGKIYDYGITVTRGNIHSYLGMNVDFSTPSLATIHLFQTREDGTTQLPEEQTQVFQHAIAQLLFLGMRARPDLIILTSFFTKHVRDPDKDGWAKIKRGLIYLHATRHTKLVINSTSIQTIHWYVNASYGVHTDYKCHTDMMMTMGHGIMIAMYMGQKINIRSSIKSKLVGIDDALGDILWGKYFIEAQGYKIDHNIVHQDNQSTILLATNGTWSKKTKHIKNHSS